MREPLLPKPDRPEPAERYDLVLKPDGDSNPALAQELTELIRQAFARIGAERLSETTWKQPKRPSSKAVAVDTGLLHDIDEEYTATAALVAERVKLAKQPDGSAEIDRRIWAAELAIRAAVEQCAADQIIAELVVKALAPLP